MNAILLFVGLWLMAASAALAQTAEEAAYVALRRQTVADLEAKRRAVPSLGESAFEDLAPR